MKERSMIVRNAIRCKKCGDTIESCFTHDMKTCSCGACSVDGGYEYIKRSGNKADYDDLSDVRILDNEAFVKQYVVCIDIHTGKPNNCGREEMKKLLHIIGSPLYGNSETGQIDLNRVNELYSLVMDKPISWLLMRIEKKPKNVKAK